MIQNLEQQIEELRIKSAGLEKDAIDEFLESGDTYEWSRHNASKYKVRDAFEQNIKAIIDNALDDKTLQATLDSIRCLLEVPYDPLYLSAKTEAPSRKDKFRDVATTVMHLVNELPETLAFVSEIGMSKEYVRMTRAAIRMIKDDENKKYKVPNGQPYHMITVKKDQLTGVNVLKQMQDNGLGRYIPDMLDIMDIMGEIEYGHMMFGFHYLPERFKLAEEAGFREQMDSVFSLVKKVRYLGSVAQSFLVPIYENVKKWEELGKKEWYVKINSLLERVAGCSPMLVYRADHQNLQKAFEDYKAAGLEDRFMPMLDFAVSEHENDTLEGHSDLTLELIPEGMELFFEFPKLYNLTGEKIFEIYKKIKANLPSTRQRAYVLYDAVHTILGYEKSTGKNVFDDWMQYLSKVSFKNDRFDIHFHWAAEDTAEMIAEGIDIRKFIPYVPEISHWGLEKSMKNIKPLILSGISESEKKAALGSYAILNNIEGLPDPDPEGRWLEKAAEVMGMEYSRMMQFAESCLIGLAIGAKEDYGERHTDYLVRGLDNLREFGIDFFKALELSPEIHQGRWYDHKPIQYLKQIINSDAPRDDKAGLINILKDEGLIYNLEKIKDFLYADVFPKDKKDSLQNYVLLRGLEGIKPGIGEKWADSTADYMGLSRENFDKLMELHRQNVFGDRTKKIVKSITLNYIDCLEAMREEGIDYLKAFEMRMELAENNLLSESSVKSLKHIINSDEPMRKKVEFLGKVTNEKLLLSALPPTNCDFNVWHKLAKRELDIIVSSADNYPREFTKSILGGTGSPGSLNLLRQIIELEKAGQHNKALFKPGKVYHTADLGGLMVPMDYTQATEYLVYGMISRNPALVRKSAAIFSPEYVSSARNFVETSHLPAQAFYRYIKNEIAILQLPNCPENGRKIAANQIIKVIKENYLSSAPKQREGARELYHMLQQIGVLRESNEFFNKVVSKIQDWKLYDLADGKRLHSCAFMSPDKEKHEIASLYYHADPHIGLGQIVPAVMGRYLIPIGNVIMANCEDKYGHLTLGVDSLEGGVMLDSVPEEIWWSSAASAIAGSAIDTGSDIVFINAQNLHGKSSRFVQMLQKRMGLGSPMEMHLAKLQGDGLLDIGNSYRYLEMWKPDERRKLSGNVTGYAFNARVFADMVGHAE